MKNISLIIILFFLVCHAKAQSWSLFRGNNITTTEYIGGDATSTIPLNLKTVTNYGISFYTNSGSYSSTRMTITGGANTTGGNVGIGYAFNPAYKLDVDGGDINVNTQTDGYRIDGDYVLWHNGDASNIYVGVDAGINDGGNNNTFVGAEAGAANTTGSQLTLLGSGASVASPNLTNATAIGADATVAASNSLVLGNGLLNVGIGTSTPAYTLQINGTVAAKQFFVEINSQTQDLLALVTQLQNEVAELKQKFRCLTQTDSVTSEIKQP